MQQVHHARTPARLSMIMIMMMPMGMLAMVMLSHYRLLLAGSVWTSLAA
jgi:hypothetical protein